MIIEGAYKYELLEATSRVRRMADGTETVLFATLTYEFKEMAGVWTGMVWNATNGHSMGIKCRSEDDAYTWFEEKTVREVEK